MKKIARMINSKTVETLFFEDDAQDLSAKFAVKREEQEFTQVKKAYNDFLIVCLGDKSGLMSPNGELILPIKFSLVKASPSVIIAQDSKELKAYLYDGTPWEHENQYRIVQVDYTNDCAILKRYRFSSAKAVYSFKEKKFLFEWTKHVRLVGRYWFFEDEKHERKAVCVESELSKLWPAEEILHFSYATMVKIDGEYKVYLPNGCVDNLGEKC